MLSLFRIPCYRALLGGVGLDGCLIEQLGIPCGVVSVDFRAGAAAAARTGLGFFAGRFLGLRHRRDRRGFDDRRRANRIGQEGRQAARLGDFRLVPAALPAEFAAATPLITTILALAPVLTIIALFTLLTLLAVAPLRTVLTDEPILALLALAFLALALLALRTLATILAVVATVELLTGLVVALEILARTTVALEALATILTFTTILSLPAILPIEALAAVLTIAAILPVAAVLTIVPVEPGRTLAFGTHLERLGL